MQPSPAEVARTLAAGRLTGTVQIACDPTRHRVRHATDCAGRLLLLSRAGSELGGTDEAAVSLRVEDVPPVDGAPHLGTVRLVGWASALAGPPVREAALEFVEANPTSDLLDVGQGFVLHQVEVAEVRLERAGTVLRIDQDEYARAEPDPLHADERDLLVDLAGHHATQIGEFVRRQLTAGGHPPGDGLPRVVRIDRYGFTIRTTDAAAPEGKACRVRLAFPRPVRDRIDLARMLHPALCYRCGAHRGCQR